MAEAESSVSPQPVAPAPQEYVVAALGASAGGIAALKRFFAAVHPGSGVAYVVILHLSPEHESNAAEVLQAVSAIPVAQARERTRIEPDHAYVVPPSKRLRVADGHLEVLQMAGIEERRAPIDMFFRTLADAHQAHVACVVLSGTGADGSLGLKRVKEAGGLCLAQDPAEAEFSDMPRSAIATDLVDQVLRAAEMPARLAAYRRNLGTPELATRDDSEDQEKGLAEIFVHLRVRTGHDFSSYKRSTVMRRLARRMDVREVSSLADYGALVRQDRDEARALLKDLLISVTHFFRDPKAFEALERTVIPRLFEAKGPEDHVRVWVAGCATGEEAYSIAMLLAERAEGLAQAPAIQVFATDIDEAALARARAGLYSAVDTVDVSPERLRRFFLRDGDGYRVRRELREMILFAVHNAIKDPPFAHLDLIACRNLLIYLDRAAQERIVKVFHFALNPFGYLFMGTSESGDDAGTLFVAADKENRIFQSRGGEASLPPPPLGPPTAVGRVASGVHLPDARARERISYQDLHLRLLEQYAPPSVVVDQDFEILHLSDRAGRYLQMGGGEPSQNLLALVLPELRLELHGALYQAVQRHERVEAVAGPVTVDGHAARVKMVVSPVFSELDPWRGLLMVVFEPVDGTPAPRPDVVEPERLAEPVARRLQDELVRLKLQMRTTVEQYELQQEELKASNEELQAMNEELRSSGEELETSKEELQSVNEELVTVNEELKSKVDELAHAHNDTRNLMNSTDIATVFVDRAMRIKLFTPRARAIFNLIAGDAGRPLLDITHRLEQADLGGDIERVLDSLVVVEREIRSIDGFWYIARVSPYRTADDRIAGVVLTFTDITRRKRAEEALRESEERVRLMVESIPEYAIFTLDEQGAIRSWNSGARQLFGYDEAEAIGQPVGLVFTPEDRAAGAPQEEMRLAREAGRAPDERWHLRKDGSRFYVSGIMAPLMRDGRLMGYTKVARDLTERHRVQEALKGAHEQLEARVAERTRELAEANEALRREIGERRESDGARVRLLRQVVSAQEDERRRIARELHDQLGQEVTALGLKLAALKLAPELQPATREQIAQLQDIVRELDSDVDFLVWDLRPTGLDDLGLAEALSDYVASWSRYFGIPAQLQSRIGGRLQPELETVLYRIAQESLTNVAKHARAGRVELVLERDADEVRLSVTDDGVGFDPLPDAKSLGLVGIRERAALVGGAAEIVSRHGAGTTVRVAVPVRGGR